MARGDEVGWSGIDYERMLDSLQIEIDDLEAEREVAHEAGDHERVRDIDDHLDELYRELEDLRKYPY